MKTAWFTGDLPEVLGWSLLHSLWQFLLLAAMYALVLRVRIFQIPQYRYLTGLFTLFCMFLCFIGTVWYEYRLLLAETTNSATLTVHLPVTSGDGPIDGENFWRISATAGIFFQKALPYLVNVWFLGIIFYMLRLLGNFVSLQQIKRRSSADLPKWIIDRVAVCLQKMQIGLPVSVRKSEEIEVPMVFGILKPMILIPAGLVLNMPAGQLEAILVHELAHVRRQDFAVNLIQSILEMLFFYHPAFWWINLSVRESREQATDDLAIGSGAKPSDLAHALAHIVNRTAMQAPELAMAAQKSGFPTLHRIQRMMGVKPSKLTSSPLITKTMMITCLLSFILLLGAARQENPTPAPWLETRSISESAHYSLRHSDLSLLDSLPDKDISYEEESIEVEIVLDSQEIGEVDLELDSIPSMTFSPPPIMEFTPPFPENVPTLSNVLIEELGDSIRIYSSKIIRFHQDSTPEGLLQKEKFEEKIKIIHKKMEETQKAFESRMKDWEAEFKPKMEAFESKMEAWRRENEPKIKDFEAKMEAWSKQQEAKFKAMEEKMREREKSMEALREKREQKPSSGPDR